MRRTGKIKRKAVDFFMDLKGAKYFEGIKRKNPVHINFVLHVENVASVMAFNALYDFCSEFLKLTGVRTTSCAVTPYSYNGKSVRALGISDEIFAERLKRLSEVSDIGYHGHFFKNILSEEDYEKMLGAFKNEARLEKKRIMANGAFPMGWANYDACAARAQIEKELGWLKGSGFSPTVYVGGCWFLSEEILLRLEEQGIKIDCSLRKSHTDVFGRRYLEDDDYAPRGVPFIIPPAKGIVEIQSIFYPTEHPVFAMEHFSNLVTYEPSKKLFVVFPAHEYELKEFASNIWRNIKIISQSHLFTWASLEDMRKIIVEEKLCESMKGHS